MDLEQYQGGCDIQINWEGAKKCECTNIDNEGRSFAQIDPFFLYIENWIKKLDINLPGIVSGSVLHSKTHPARLLFNSHI